MDFLDWVTELICVSTAETVFFFFKFHATANQNNNTVLCKFLGQNLCLWINIWYQSAVLHLVSVLPVCKVYFFCMFELTGNRSLLLGRNNSTTSSMYIICLGSGCVSMAVVVTVSGSTCRVRVKSRCVSYPGSFRS